MTAGLDDLCCRGGQRRRLVRASRELTGLDYVDVAPDGRHLFVHLLADAPQDLVPGNLRLTWPPGARPVRVLDLDTGGEDDPDDDDCLTIRLDRPGDSACYRLELVEADERGRPTRARLAGCDPRFAAVEFRFTVNCNSDLDCGPASCDPLSPAPPAADLRYLAKDYASFRQLILDRLAVSVPEWRETHAPDLAITLVEILAYVGDHLSYYQDAVATEAYLETARLRTSVRRHARLVDYLMHEGCNARVWVVLSPDTELEIDGSRTAFLTAVTAQGVPLPTVVAPEDLEFIDTDPAWFEPVDTGPITLRPAHREIRIHTWADEQCCLPAGSTGAALVDQGDDGARCLHLAPGDWLLLEEVLGPGTGDPADADPGHQHVVRLTEVTAAEDPLTGTLILQVHWDIADALPFPLCLSAIGPAPDCALLEPVSLARGNVLLADAGRTVTEPGWPVPVVSQQLPCADGCPDPPVLVPGPFRPVLSGAPLTFRVPPVGGPASGALAQDPRAALPQLTLTSTGGRDDPAGWEPRPDLLHSGPDDRHVVVEIDDDGIGRLRFGDDVLSRAPSAGESFVPVYRIGNGPAGNIGGRSLAHVVLPSRPDGVDLAVTNPMAAAGGTAAEPVDQVRAHAPHLFRHELRRAVTEADYATLAQRDFPAQVQRAAAELRWNGSWYEMRVAIDPLGLAEAPAALLTAVRDRLERYRRIGHDLVVVPATGVGLQIGITVCIGSGYRRSDVLTAVGARLGTGRLPGGGLAMFHPDAVTFGAQISVSGLVAAVAGVPGVDNAIVTTLDRFGGGDPTVLAEGVLTLGAGEVPRLDNDPAAPENGVLVLTPVGGR
jgi:Baseplate J-like protein